MILYCNKSGVNMISLSLSLKIPHCTILWDTDTPVEGMIHTPGGTEWGWLEMSSRYSE